MSASNPDAICVRDGAVLPPRACRQASTPALAISRIGLQPRVGPQRGAVVGVLKHAGGQSQFSVLVEADPPPESALKVTNDAIAADPGNDHSAKKLASRVCLSTRQLTQLFQSELGITPALYVELVRIDFTRAALEAGRTVTEAAYLTGFSSKKTPRRAFLNHLGIAPKPIGIDSAPPAFENGSAARK